MTDFYGLLKQSMLSRGIRDPGQRQTVYAQARTALIRQLSQQDPKPTTGEITASVMEFDRAMRRIEGELVAEMAAADALGHPSANAAAGERGDEAYADPPEVEREATGWDVRDRAADDDPTPVASDDEVPPRAVRDWADRPPPSRGALARRATTPPPVLAEDDEDAPPFSRQWNDEEAVRTNQAVEDDARKRLPPPQRRLGWTLSERDKIRVLIGAISALVLVLVGLLVYLLLPHGNAVSFPIDRQGSVSDAAAADRIASAKLDVKQSFALFDGHDPTVFQASSDNPVRVDSDSQGSFARVGTSTASTGVKVAIGPGLAALLAGQNVRIVVTARSAPERGALNMRFAYQSGVVLSHWQTANLKPAYAAVGMTWIVPQMRTSPTGSDYLLIEPGIPGDDTAVDISAIRIDLLSSAPTT